MNLTQINPKEAPEKYFPYDTLDGEGSPIWKKCLPQIQTVESLQYFGLRRLGEGGTTDLVVLGNKILLFLEDQLVATSVVKLQYDQGGWKEHDPSEVWYIDRDEALGTIHSYHDTDSKGNIDIQANWSNTPVYDEEEPPNLIDCDVDKKLTFSIDRSGSTVRCVWEITLESGWNWRDPDNLTDKDVWWDISDYTGNVDDSVNGQVRTVTFEPAGVADSLTVDPYLSVEDKASYYAVYCDGFTIRVYHGDQTTGMARLYGPEDSGIYSAIWEVRILSGATYYYFRSDVDRSVTLAENNTLRAVFRIKGMLEDVGNTPLTNLDYAEMYMVIEPDRVKLFVRYVVGSGGNVTVDAGFNTIICSMNTELTNENEFSENSGSELEASSATYYNSAKYWLVTADEANIQYIKGDVQFGAGSTVSWYARNMTADTGNWRIGFTDGYLAQDTETTIFVVLIIDSVLREGSAKIYAEADRIDMGNQYQDHDFDGSPDVGSVVDDMVIPAQLTANETLHWSGAHLYSALNLAAGVTGLTPSIDRHRPAFRLLDWPFHTGAVESPTDHLIEHLKVNDNAASSVIAAAVGNDGNWEDTSAGNRNTDNDDISTNIQRGTGLDTAGAYHIDHSVTIYDNAYFKQGTKILNCTPQFAFDVATDQTIWSLWVDADDFIKITYDAANNRYELAVSWSATLTTLNGAAFTENYSLQRLTTICAGWDSEKDFLFLSIDGQVVDFGTNAGTPSVAGATYVMTGADCENDATGTLEADIYIDENKAIDGCILPFGAFHIGNGAGLLADIATPDKDLCWFWDCQAIGTDAAKGGADLASSFTLTTEAGSPQVGSTYALVGPNGYDMNGNNSYLSQPVTSNDVIDFSIGSALIWVNFQALDSATRYVWYPRTDGNNNMFVGLDSSNRIYMRYETQSVPVLQTMATAAETGVWYCIFASWNDTGRTDLWVNNVRQGTRASPASPWVGTSGTIYIGNSSGAAADCWIGRIFINKKELTSQIWTAFGTPRHSPLTGKA